MPRFFQGEALGRDFGFDVEKELAAIGQGEYFIRVNAAAQVAWRMRLAGEALDAAAAATLDQIGALGGDGGLIALDAAGIITMPYNSQGMKRACLHADGRIEALVFEG